MSKGMIDKVFSIVIVMVIVLVLSIFLYISVFSGYAAEQTLGQQKYGQEYGDTLVNSLLISHEQESDLTYEALLQQSLQQISTTVLVNGKPIDVKGKFKTALDRLIGENKYYFELRPTVKGVSISYVLDGNPTMQAKRAAVNAQLPSLIVSLTKLFGPQTALYTHIYIFDSSVGETHCNEFSVAGQGGVTCEDVHGEDLYQYLELHGFAPPAPAPYTTYDQWLYSSHAAQTGHLSEADWASGVSYASWKYKENAMEQEETNKHVIVAVADQLSSNSKSDACHDIPTLQRHNTEDASDMYICFLCNATCPFTRAGNVTDQAKLVVQKNGDLFLGFHSFPCDFVPAPTLSQVELTPYMCTYIDNQNKCQDVVDQTRPGNAAVKNPSAASVGVTNWCDQNACGGCTKPTPFSGTYCFHNNCDNQVITDMGKLSTATGGTVNTLTPNNLDLLTKTVSDYFTNQEVSYDFKLGTKNESKERYVIEHKMILSNGKQVMLTFWIYK